MFLKEKSLVAIAFEVMDKEPSLLATLLLYGALSTLGLVLSRRRWWWGLLVLPVSGLFAYLDLGELRDPSVGPAIVEEAGYLHVIIWYVCIVGSFIVPIIGAVTKHRSQSSQLGDPR